MYGQHFIQSLVFGLTQKLKTMKLYILQPQKRMQFTPAHYFQIPATLGSK